MAQVEPTEQEMANARNYCTAWGLTDDPDSSCIYDLALCMASDRVQVREATIRECAVIARGCVSGQAAAADAILDLLTPTKTTK